MGIQSIGGASASYAAMNAAKTQEASKQVSASHAQNAKQVAKVAESKPAESGHVGTKINTYA